jgi:3-oxoacyl-[acyl-carrier-protein] synthase II
MNGWPRRVVVTGMGAVTSLGHDVGRVFQHLLRGESGIRALDRFDTTTCPCKIGGQITGFDPRDFFTDRPTLRHLRVMDPVHQWALCAAKQALADAGLEEALFAAAQAEGARAGPVDPDAVGVCLGTGLSGRLASEQISTSMFGNPRFQGVAQRWAEGSHAEFYRALGEYLRKDMNPMYFVQQCPSTAAAYLAMRYRARGPNLTVVSLCAAGAQAVGEAAWVVARGDADVMLAGGADSMLNLVDLTAFYTLDAVSGWGGPPGQACKPFDLRRDGCVIGEGAAVLVLEGLDHAQRRGALIHAELAGYGTSDDAYKITAPPEDGSGAVLAMRRALERAGLAPEQVDHINAHGTGTPLNDRIETLAIKQAFGSRAHAIPVVSTKSMTGHLIAAAGALEAVIAVETIRHRTVPPTLNLEKPDPQCDLDYVPDGPRRLDRLDVVLSNSFAVGGVNAALIFRRWTGGPS